MHRVAGTTNDMVVWYEIWSKTGAGARLTGMDTAIKELQAKGVRLVNAEPEARAHGANVFIHPKSAHGVMIELLEKGK